MSSSPPGYCGLDRLVIPSSGVLLMSSRVLEALDVREYCAGYVRYALLLIGLEGLVLRLATLVALQARGFCGW